MHFLRRWQNLVIAHAWKACALTGLGVQISLSAIEPQRGFHPLANLRLLLTPPTAYCPAVRERRGEEIVIFSLPEEM